MSETDLTHGVFLKENPSSGQYRELLQWPVLGLVFAVLCTFAWWAFLGWAFFWYYALHS